jgi:hypothetical protein
MGPLQHETTIRTVLGKMWGSHRSMFVSACSEIQVCVRPAQDNESSIEGKLGANGWMDWMDYFVFGQLDREVTTSRTGLR